MIKSILALLLECAKLTLAVCGCLNYKRKKKPMVSVCLFLFSVLIVCVLIVMDRGNQVAVFYAAAIPIVALAVEGENKFVFSILTFFGISFLDDFILLFLRGTLFKVLNIPDDTKAVLMAGMISLSVLALLAFFLQRVVYSRWAMANRFFQSIPRTYVLVLALGMFTACALTIPYTSTDAEWSRENAKVLAITSAVFCIVFLVVGGLMIYNNVSKLHYMQTAKLNQERMELKENYYRNLLEKEQETRRFRHDMSAHMTCLKDMLEKNRIEEAKDYLKKLSGGLDYLKQKVQTGNMVINAILSDISERYKEVQLEWDGILPDSLALSDMDLCVIFSNLLENAFLAASACGEQGYVQTKAEIISGALKVELRNAMAKPIEKREERFITQKSDKENHGFGILNVKECVTANGGKVCFEYTETSFTVKLMLPNILSR